MIGTTTATFILAVVSLLYSVIAAQTRIPDPVFLNSYWENLPNGTFVKKECAQWQVFDKSILQCKASQTSNIQCPDKRFSNGTCTSGRCQEGHICVENSYCCAFPTIINSWEGYTNCWEGYVSNGEFSCVTMQQATACYRKIGSFCLNTQCCELLSRSLTVSPQTNPQPAAGNVCPPGFSGGDRRCMTLQEIQSCQNTVGGGHVCIDFRCCQITALLQPSQSGLSSLCWNGQPGVGSCVNGICPIRHVCYAGLSNTCCLAPEFVCPSGNQPLGSCDNGYCSVGICTNGVCCYDSDKRTTEDLCTYPVDGGIECNSRPVSRWYYSTQSKQCATFTFTSCGGNQNNFQTLSECQSRCQTLVTTPPNIRCMDNTIPTDRCDANHSCLPGFSCIQSLGYCCPAINEELRFASVAPNIRCMDNTIPTDRCDANRNCLPGFSCMQSLGYCCPAIIF